MGLPGVLPVLIKPSSKKRSSSGLALAPRLIVCLALIGKITFTQTLPKGYQITQMDAPIVLAGAITIEVDGTEKVIRITRAHLEEDAGKSIHDAVDHATAIDLNRAGTPLLEIVSEPDMKSAEEAVAYARKIHQLVTYLDVCDGNMAGVRCALMPTFRLSATTPSSLGREAKSKTSTRSDSSSKRSNTRLNDRSKR